MKVLSTKSHFALKWNRREHYHFNKRAFSPLKFNVVLVGLQKGTFSCYLLEKTCYHEFSVFKYM